MEYQEICREWNYIPGTEKPIVILFMADIDSKDKYLVAIDHSSGQTLYTTFNSDSFTHCMDEMLQWMHEVSNQHGMKLG